MRAEESVRERCEENKNGFRGEPTPSREGGGAGAEEKKLAAAKRRVHAPTAVLCVPVLTANPVTSSRRLPRGRVCDITCV